MSQRSPQKLAFMGAVHWCGFLFHLSLYFQNNRCHFHRGYNRHNSFLYQGWWGSCLCSHRYDKISRTQTVACCLYSSFSQAWTLLLFLEMEHALQLQLNLVEPGLCKQHSTPMLRIAMAMRSLEVPQCFCSICYFLCLPSFLFLGSWCWVVLMIPVLLEFINYNFYFVTCKVEGGSIRMLEIGYWYPRLPLPSYPLTYYERTILSPLIGVRPSLGPFHNTSCTW